MILTYTEFINESLSGIERGDHIIFLTDSVGDEVIPGIKNKIGIIKERSKRVLIFGESYIIIELEKPFTHNGIILNEFKLRPEHANQFKKLKNYEYFEIKQFEKGLFPVICSEEISNILSVINFYIKDTYNEVSFLELAPDPDYITFIPSNKCKDPNKEKYRQTTRIGRILKKLNSSYNDKKIEDFTNQFKAEVKISKELVPVQVVTGDDIVYWYNEKNYREGGGSLNNSCMRFYSARNKIKLYARHPNQIALAIIVENDKLYARSLIWKLDDGNIYMDRIYAVDDKTKQIVRKYAIQRNMWYFDDGEEHKMKVTLKGESKYIEDEDDDENVPYFDTFEIEKVKKKNVVLRGT